MKHLYAKEYNSWFAFYLLSIVVSILIIFPILDLLKVEQKTFSLIIGIVSANFLSRYIVSRIPKLTFIKSLGIIVFSIFLLVVGTWVSKMLFS